MTDKEIRMKLEEFIEEIYKVNSEAKAKELDRRIDAFCEENNVSEDQMRVFIDSGAGEMLYMKAY